MSSSGSVVDANVWVSALLPHEPHHAASASWLIQSTTNGNMATCPNLLLPEIAGALARQSRTWDPVAATITDLTALSGLRLVAVDDALAWEAAELAATLHLRGADAVYVALAAQLDIPLFTWDREILHRAAGVVDVRTPNAS